MDVTTEIDCCSVESLFRAKKRPLGCSLARWRMEIGRRLRDGLIAPFAEDIVEVPTELGFVLEEPPLEEDFNLF